MSQTVALCYPVENTHLDQIRGVDAGIQVVNAGQERIADELLRADIFCGHAKVPVPWPEIVRRGKLRWIQSSAAGMDHCLTPEVVDSPILVTSASGLFADQVAEHTLALLLGLLRSLPVFFRAAEHREFVRRPTGDLHGKTIGIVGFGGNGRRLAEVLSVFRPRILATDLFPIDRPDHVDHLWDPSRLDDVLAVADILILCVPLTAETHGMINAGAFSKMRPGSLVVNVARGPVVVERDLIAALESGHLAGAGLDVTEVEPLPADSPLWELPNVIITPHVGAQSVRRAADTTNLFVDNLKRFLAGKSLINLVDKRLGFPRRV